MPDQDAGEDAFQDDPVWDAVEARFRPEAFTGVAQALDLTEDPETLACLRDMLLPEFRFFGVEPRQKVSRDERIDRLKKLRAAATALEAQLGPGGAWSSLPLKLWDSNLITDQFTDTLRVLAREAEGQIQRLRSSRGKNGRPRKDAARQLGVDLIRVFAKITRKRPKDLNFKQFNRFAAAVFRCLRICVPAVGGRIHPTQRALREMLKEVWELELDQKDEKPLPVEIQ